jgi:imidazolonepropionase-like amidohydrolase
MRRVEGHTRLVAVAVAVIAPLLLLSACSDSGEESAPATSDVVVYEGARVLTGDGSVIDDAVFIVEEDRFAAVGPRGDVEAPEGARRVDLSGRTVMPAIVNAHVHLSSDPAERAEQQRHMAYYGAGTVLSLGLDEDETAFEMRGATVAGGVRTFTAGRGITSPEPGRSEVPYWVTTEEEAREAVREVAEQDVDMVKIWVDDRNGQYERLSPELYGAVIDEAHQHGLQVAAHVFTLEDAKGLLRAGIDAFAHGIRDTDIDDELVELWTARPNVVLIPNLPGPGVAPTDLDWLSGTVAAEEIDEMEASAQARPAAQAAFGIQARNLDRLDEEGVTIAFGTDGSTPWAVHQELEDMVRAGMEPGDVIVAATRNAADLLGLSDVGRIATGASADFVVLEADPLDDITNTRRIDSVYLRGAAMDRAGFSGEALAGSGP